MGRPDRVREANVEREVKAEAEHSQGWREVVRALDLWQLVFGLIIVFSFVVGGSV